MGNLEELLWNRGDFVEYWVKRFRRLGLARNVIIFRLFWAIGKVMRESLCILRIKESSKKYYMILIYFKIYKEL